MDPRYYGMRSLGAQAGRFEIEDSVCLNRRDSKTVKVI